MGFFKQMLSSETDVSSKRFISIISLLLYTIAFFSSMCGIIIEEEIWYTLVSLVLGSSLLTLNRNK